MKELIKEINYIECSFEELCDGDKFLVQRMRISKRSSYSPYSSFKVGAAVLLENGEMIGGSNQENAAYPSGMCAERVVIYYAGTLNSQVVSIAVSAMPCGACLQAMKESEDRAKKRLHIIIENDMESFFVFNGVDSLMPFSFVL